MNATKTTYRPEHPKYATHKSSYKGKLETLRRKEVRKIKSEALTSRQTSQTSDFGKMK